MKASGFSSLACVAQIILQQLLGVSLWFFWLPQSCRDIRNLALTPAELMEIRAASSPLKPMCHCPVSTKWTLGICFPRMSEWQPLPLLCPPITGPSDTSCSYPVPSAPAAGVWISDALSQQFPAIAFLLVRDGRRKEAFIDQVMPKFDRDLLSVLLLWSSANSVVTVWGGRVSQTRDQK